MCLPHTAICVRILLYMCLPHTTICVLMLLCMCAQMLQEALGVDRTFSPVHNNLGALFAHSFACSKASSSKASSSKASSKAANSALNEGTSASTSAKKDRKKTKTCAAAALASSVSQKQNTGGKGSRSAGQVAAAEVEDEYLQGIRRECQALVHALQQEVQQLQQACTETPGRVLKETY